MAKTYWRLHSFSIQPETKLDTYWAVAIPNFTCILYLFICRCYLQSCLKPVLENYFYFSSLMISVSSFCHQHVLFSAAISLIVDGRRLYQDTHVHWYQSYSYYLKNEKRLKIETYTYNWYWLHFPVSRVWMNKFICVWQMHIKWWAEGCSFTYGSEKSTWQSI